ncbi:MAG TPA: gliding motility-associated C-terminal domain-containing protein [Parafilimonas sp.]
MIARQPNTATQCNVKRILLFCLLIYFIYQNKLIAQITYQLPPNQPEQDACNALQLCGGSIFIPYSYTGTGKHSDLDQTPCFQSAGGAEKNSVWLKLHVLQSGSIVFKIQPVDPQDDYDFAVVDATGKDCSALTSNDVIRCNFNSNIPGSNAKGVIGLSDTSRTPYIQKGAFGYSFAQAAFAKSGGTYLIMINSNGNYVSGGSSKGFTIDFSGSSAVFYNSETPQINNIDVPCNNASSITLKTTSEILCNSIAFDGSDFTSNAPSKIISASGINCTGNGGYTNSIVINFSSALPQGTYNIQLKKGNDNNTLMSLCNNELLPNAFTFIVKQNGKEAIDNEFICYQQLPFYWHGLKLNNSDSGKVYVTKSAEGCDSTTVLNLHVSQAPQQASLSKTICDGDFYILPWDSAVYSAGTYIHHFTNTNGCDSLVESVTVSVIIPKSGGVEARDSTIQTGFCQQGSALLSVSNDFTNYLWNTGQTTNSIIVNVAGTYSLNAIDKDGCVTIDTFVVAAYPYPAAAFHNVENLCSDSSITLDAGAGFIYYLWNTGSTEETIITNKPGKFWVALASAHNCSATDTVNVVTVQRPVNFLIQSVTKCSFKDVTLTPLNNFNAYTWSNGSNTKSIDVSAGGLYWLNVTDYNGCSGSDSITVVDSTCPRYFFMPTAFTPNNDRHDDIFKPAFSGTISGFRLSIYNRWGKLIFSTSDPSTGWDGTIKGFQQPIGSYIWICSYSLYGDSLHTEKGTVTLLR